MDCLDFGDDFGDDDFGDDDFGDGFGDGFGDDFNVDVGEPEDRIGGGGLVYMVTTLSWDTPVSSAKVRSADSSAEACASRLIGGVFALA